MKNLPTIGFIGLGDMGLPISRNLLQAGYQVIGFDLNADRLAAVVHEGATPAANLVDLVSQVNFICTSLPSSSIFVQVAEKELLPNIRQGQIVIDFGTVTPPETRRLATLFAQKGVHLLDVPLSGGVAGAEQGRLYMFAGGDEQAIAQVMPIVETVGGAKDFTYCGPAGSGQVVKGVNQLMMGIVNAAYLEAISFGVNSGVSIETIKQAIGCEGHLRSDFNRIAQRIADGNGLEVGVKFRELPYFLQAAEAAEFELPITETVYRRSDQGERVTIDDHRQAPSYWHELMGSPSTATHTDSSGPTDTH